MNEEKKIILTWDEVFEAMKMSSMTYGGKPIDELHGVDVFSVKKLLGFEGESK